MNNVGIKNVKTKNHVIKTLIYFLAVLFSVIFMVPFLWMLFTSLKSFQEIYANPPTVWPHQLYWGNYGLAVTKMPFLLYFWNTFLIAAINVLGTVLSCSMVAYALSKVKWRGSNFLFPFIVATMMIPYQVTMIPVYLIWTKLGFVGTYIPLTLPSFFGSAYYIFLLRQFFKTIPDALVEAAVIDGARGTTIFTRIMMPLCKPAITTVGILTFLANWSDFLGPLLYLNDQSQYTLSIGLQTFMQTHYVEWGPLMAAAAIFTVPVIILFFFAQSYFIEGITVTGIKG